MKRLIPLILVLVGCTHGREAPTTTAPTTSTTTTTVSASGITADSFGLFDVPADPRSFEAVEDLGVGWVRIQFRLGERDPELLLDVTGRLADEGIGLWLTIHHRDPDNVPDPDALARSERGSFPAVDEDRYVDDLAALIEEITSQILAAGGDPGEELIVQFSNEVIPSDHAPDQPSRYFHGSGDEYLRMLELTGSAAAAVDPAIGIAAGGISSSALDAILAAEAGDSRFAEVAAWNDRLLTEGEFDWVDVHIRGEADTIPLRLDWVHQRWSGPIAATEVGGVCDSGCSNIDAAYTPEFQASDLPAKMTALLDEGLEIVFWASLVESPDQEPQYEVEGLMTIDWEPKPAYRAYRELIESYR